MNINKNEKTYKCKILGTDVAETVDNVNQQHLTKFIEIKIKNNQNENDVLTLKVNIND